MILPCGAQCCQSYVALHSGEPKYQESGIGREELNFSKNMEEIVRNKKINFPLTINKDLIELLIDKNNKKDDTPFMMYS